MPARGWHCLQDWWGQRPPASTPGGGGPAAGREQGFTARTPPSCWAQLACKSKAADLPCSWTGAAFSPKCLQRSWEEQQGRKADLHADLEQFPSPSGLTRVRQTSASSW